VIGISTRIFDVFGYDTFQPHEINSLMDKTHRRVSSVATLDGSSYVSDQGYSATDKQFVLSLVELSQDRVDNLIRIAKNHSRIVVSTSTGVYEGIMKEIYYLHGKLNIQIVIVGEA